MSPCLAATFACTSVRRRAPTSQARAHNSSSIRMSVKQVPTTEDGTDVSSSQKGDFLKLFWTLAESDGSVRTQAAAQLLAHLEHSPKQETEVQYTLKRLVRGLASSRDAARQGFSTALSGLLTAFPTHLSLPSTHNLLTEAMEVHSSMKPMEQREHVFGRLFGLLALHRSGRLSTDVPLLVTVVKELVEMATFKRWFRETCYQAVLTIVVDVPVEDFITDVATVIHKTLQSQHAKGSEEEGVDAWNADQVLLAVGVQRYLYMTGIVQNQALMKRLPDKFAPVKILQRHNVHVLARPLRGSSGCYPRVHSAWFGVFGHVLNPTEDASATLDSELFQETWTALVENSLVGGSSSDESAPTSHERQGLALKLFDLVAPNLPAPVVRAILTPRFVKCLYNNAVAKRNYLHEAARHCLKTFAACAPAEFFRFFRKQFSSPLSSLVTFASADSHEEEDENLKKKKQKLNAGSFNALIEIEEKKEREEAVKRRTDRTRVWTVEIMVASLSEMLSTKLESDSATEKLQNDVLRFLVFHSFFMLSSDESTPSKKNKKNKKAKKTELAEVNEVVQEATAASPALSKTVVDYVKTRLFSLLSLGLAGADGVLASASVLGHIFAIAKDMQCNSATISLRDPLDDEALAQFNGLADHVDALRSKEENEGKMLKKTVTRRPLSETFLLLFMSVGLQFLDGEQREDAAVVAADLKKCYAQLVARKQDATPTKHKHKKKELNESEEMKEEPVVVLTDLLLSLLSEDSSALREIVSQVFRSLLPLLNGACLTTIINVLQPTAEGTAAGEEDEEFAPITRRDGEEGSGEDEEEVVLDSADALSDALRNDKKLAALYQEDLALAAFVGQVKVRSQRKKDLKRTRLHTMHFQLRVLDLLQVFVSQRPEQTEEATAKHNALVLSVVAPLFRVFTRVQNGDSTKLVLRDRLQAVLHKVLRSKDKIPTDKTSQTEARDCLRQIVALIRTTPMDKDHVGKVASAAIVYLVRVICSSESSSDEEVQTIIHESVVDAFTKKHSRFPRASFEELLMKSPAVGVRVLLEPLAAVAAASEKKEDVDESAVRAAVDEFSKCEVFRLLTVLLRASGKLQQTGDLSKAQGSAFNRVQKSLRTALVRQLDPESVRQLKAKRMKVVMMFALQLVKFWCSSTDKKATEADVCAVVAAVQAVDSNSPVVKGIARQISEAAGFPYVCTNRTKAGMKVLTEIDDEVMPEDNDTDDADTAAKTKTMTKSSQDKQKQKRKRSGATE